MIIKFLQYIQENTTPIESSVVDPNEDVWQTLKNLSSFTNTIPYSETLIYQILMENMNHVEIQDIRKKWNVLQCDEMLFYLNGCHFNFLFEAVPEKFERLWITSPEDMKLYQFKNLTASQKQNLTQTLLNKIGPEIQKRPSLYYELSPGLQKKYGALMQPLGGDFGFLETANYEVLADFITTLDDTVFLTKLSRKVLELAPKRNGSNIEKVLREAKDRVYNIVSQHTTDITAWKTWSRDKATEVLQFDLWKSTFCLWLAKWPTADDRGSRYTYDNYFLLENNSVPVTRDEGTKLVSLILSALKHALINQPSLYSELTPNLQRYFQPDFKHLGTDFGFFE
jgi:hypothetical protein